MQAGSMMLMDNEAVPHESLPLSQYSITPLLILGIISFQIANPRSNYFCLTHLSNSHELLTIKIVTKINPGRLIKKGDYQFSSFRVLTEGQSGGYFDIITMHKPRQLTHRSSQPLLAKIN
jgi:hypothetical protein